MPRIDFFPPSKFKNSSSGNVVYADLSLTDLEKVWSGYLGHIGGGEGDLSSCSLFLGQGCSPAPGRAPWCGPAGPVQSWCWPLSRCVRRRQHSSQTPDLYCFASAVNAVCQKYFLKNTAAGFFRCRFLDFFAQQPQEHSLFLCPPVSCVSQDEACFNNCT